MKVVTIAAAKGGATKSTVTALLAVRATKGGKRVALFDLNGDQGDLTQWYALRSKPRRSPLFLRLIPVQKISLDIDVLVEGVDHCSDFLFHRSFPFRRGHGDEAVEVVASLAEGIESPDVRMPSPTVTGVDVAD